MITASLISIINEKDSLKRTLESSQTDYNIIVDGRYIGADLPELSTDGTRDLIKEFDNCILIDAPDFHEWEKRTHYLIKCWEMKIDYGIIIDGDEYYQGDWNQFKKNLENLNPTRNVYGMKYHHKDCGFYYAPRVWHDPGSMTYDGVHNIFKNIYTGTQFISGQNTENIEGLTIFSDDSLRPQDHVDKVYQYQVNLINYEQKRYNSIVGWR